MQYLLDTNVFINAYNLYYKKNVVPSFWEFLKDDEDIFTIQEVKEETKPGEDALYELIAPVKIKENLDASIASKISTLVEQSYKLQAARGFFKVADFPLICIAKEHKMTLVTFERFSDSLTKIKIPNVCEKLNIQCINTYELLENKKVCLGKSYTYRK